MVASGNGGQHNDNCNYDGYANSIYTVTIGRGPSGPTAHGCSRCVCVCEREVKGKNDKELYELEL